MLGILELMMLEKGTGRWHQESWTMEPSPGHQEGGLWNPHRLFGHPCPFPGSSQHLDSS